MISRKNIKSLLISTTLIWSTPSYSDGYSEIGYKNGLSIETNMNISGPVFIRTELSGEDVASYGIGLGYDFNPLNVMFTADRIGDNEFEYGVQFAHIDIGWSWYADLSYKSSKELGYKIGLGWSYNEKISLVTYYSDNGCFVGIRRLF